jgi:predicted GNAT family acetyltransferase
MPDAALPPVVHETAAARFKVLVGGQEAVADYVLQGGTMVLTHTYVPPGLRGRGLAERLVRAALEHARAGRFRVEPACSYVATFMDRHPEYRDLLAGGAR